MNNNKQKTTPAIKVPPVHRLLQRSKTKGVLTLSALGPSLVTVKAHEPLELTEDWIDISIVPDDVNNYFGRITMYLDSIPSNSKLCLRVDTELADIDDDRWFSLLQALRQRTKDGDLIVIDVRTPTVKHRCSDALVHQVDVVFAKKSNRFLLVRESNHPRIRMQWSRQAPFDITF